MAEEKLEQKVQEPEEEEEQKQLQSGITLTKEEYENLLTKIAQLEARQNYAMQREEIEPEPQVEEEPDVSDDEFAKMTPAQFYNKIMADVGTRVTKPLLESIAILNIKFEIDQARREFQDFDQYFNEIREEAIRNPMMRIKDVYMLIKARKGESISNKSAVPPAGGKKETPSPPPVGEKPGAAKSSISIAPKTLREAAILAAEQLALGEKKGKEE